MKKVLVVDDTKNIRVLLTKCLELEGYAVENAADGKNALEMMGKQSFDLIFMDIKMPQLSGTEVLRRMRDMGIYTPVVIITAYATVKNAVECTQMGAVAYIQKPFTAEKVRTVLEEIESKKNEGLDSGSLIQSINMLIEENKLDEAFEQAKKALSLNPDNGMIYYLMSKIYDRKNDKRLAEKYLSISKMLNE